MRLLNRRAFLKDITQAGATICLGGIKPLLCYSNPISRKVNVSLVRSPKVWDGNRLDPSIIRKMLDQGIQSISGCDLVSKAWNSLFSSRDIVAMKVNCIGKETGSTKPELSYAVAECLHKYVNIPLENIIIFDRSDKELALAGYRINKSQKGIKIYETPSYSPRIKSGRISIDISTIITEKCTALINLPLLKTHRGAKLTLALKNHYGSIAPEIVQTNKFHSEGFENVVHVNSNSLIKEKTRLCIADGLIAQFDQGPRGDPRYQWRYAGLIMGTDPVAVDTLGLEVINEKRKAENLSPFRVRYLKWAAREGLGEHDNISIELMKETI
jgi:uncharacterized protein (DUF362 family)